jgi:hypothetical protein
VEPSVTVLVENLRVQNGFGFLEAAVVDGGADRVQIRAGDYGEQAVFYDQSHSVFHEVELPHPVHLTVFLVALEFMVMAFDGHRLTQTPHSVQEAASTIRGFFPPSASNIPCGQTPMQMSEGQTEHLEKSKETSSLALFIGESTTK